MSTFLSAGLLGRLAVDQGLITMDQLVQATGEQSRSEGRERLGEVFVRLEFLSEAQVDELLELQRRDLQRIEDERESRTQTAPVLDQAALIAAAQAELNSQAAAAGEDRDRATRDWLLTVLRQATEWRATDVHLQGGAPVMFRVVGALLGPSSPMTAEQVEEVARLAMPAKAQGRFERGEPVAFGMSVRGAGRFRVHVMHGEGGVEAAFRWLPAEPPSLAGLALPGELARIASASSGLMLVTGPARSGRTCTLAALVRIISEERRARIVTVERPVEILHASSRCLVSQLDVGRDVPSWHAGLDAASDADADVVVLGDLADEAVADRAIALADSGRLVLACATPVLTRYVGSQARAVVTLRVERPELGDTLVHIAQVHWM